MYDLFFQIRHDRAKVSRLKTFLSWKDVRKTAKDSDEKGPDQDIGLDDPPVPDAPNPTDPNASKKASANKRTRITASTAPTDPRRKWRLIGSVEREFSATEPKQVA